MTEAEWLTAVLARPMLEQIGPDIPPRKLRLLTCGVWRWQWERLPDPLYQRVIEVGERMADGVASAEELRTLHEELRWYDLVPLEQTAQFFLWLGDLRSAVTFRLSAADYIPPPNVGGKLLCDLVRDLFGNPFRPARLDPVWLHSSDGAVSRVARSIYDERRWSEMPVLGDALEEAGCTDPGILNHCHAEPIHARGCWLVDRLLGLDVTSRGA
jgi:hypothetical protein